ncbi:MAG: ABC transporter permease subunit [Alphaproteobacteria bacterium]|nr:ABC transporter permease subunit [Alphaproteobacteria bacterium]
MRNRLTPITLGTMLVALYLFLFAPVIYLVYASFARDTVWPFPWHFTVAGYVDLAGARAYQQALWNSVVLASAAAFLAMALSAMGSIAVLKYRHRWRGAFAIIIVSPMFVAELLIGISTLIFNRKVLGLPGNMGSAIVANAVHGMAFGFLIMLAQLVRYDWRLDDAAQVFGAGPYRTFWYVTLPNIWPAMLGAFVLSFLLAFNNLEISFYNLGAIPTLPSLAWGSLRYGLKPELFALAALVNGVVFAAFAVIYALMRTGLVRFGYRGI